MRLGIDVILGMCLLSSNNQIVFNAPMKEFGGDLDSHIVHEMVHHAQDLLNKYPAMRGNTINEVIKKTELPWEQEAYRIMNNKAIITSFQENCKLADW